MLRNLRRLSVCLLGALLVASMGCAKSQTCAQAEDEAEHDRYDVETAGEMLDGVTNADPIAVSGIGLVINLEGTGGGAPQGEYRTMLKEELQKRLKMVPELRGRYKNAEEVLNDPGNAMVMVSGLIPAGVRKDDPIDVDVSLPGGSKTTSLRGGTLLECPLYDYNTTKTLDPKYTGGNNAILGHVRAKAKGSVLVGFGDSDEGKLKQGRIWGGGRSNMDRPFLLTLDSKHQQVRIAMGAADRINEAFNGPFRGAGTGGIACAKNNVVIELTPPHQYKYNLCSFLRVVRLVPIREGKNAKKKENAVPGQTPGILYRRQLEEDLLDPSRCVVAALRLEALGSESVPAVEAGCSARNMSWSASARPRRWPISTARRRARSWRHWSRSTGRCAYSLTALASLDEAVSRVKLRELLTEPAPETRYGAFRALRSLDEHDPLVQGELMNQSWLAAPDRCRRRRPWSTSRPRVGRRLCCSARTPT